jgi:enamine deaminase RidA (YjgF/YER057c/UK114 family)
MLTIKNAVLFCVMMFSSLLVFAEETGLLKKNHAEYRQAGNFIFISSLAPIDPVSGQAPKEAEDQVNQVFANLHALVTKLGIDMNDIVKITVYVTNRDTIMPLVDKTMDQYFIVEPYAARTPVTTTFGSKPYVISVDAIVYHEAKL